MLVRTIDERRRGARTHLNLWLNTPVKVTLLKFQHVALTTSTSQTNHTTHNLVQTKLPNV
jgi:hypothetical protein